MAGSSTWRLGHWCDRLQPGLTLSGKGTPPAVVDILQTNVDDLLDRRDAFGVKNP